MIKRIIEIRLKQTGRNLATIGIFRMVFLFALLLLLGIFLYNQYKVHTNGLYATGVYLFLLLSVHLQRNDKKFLQLITSKKTVIFIAEYTVISLPIFSLILLNLYFDLFLILAGGIILISLLKINFNFKGIYKNNLIINLIPHNCFEIKSGVRVNFIILVVFYLTGLVLSYLRITIPVVIFFITTIFISFYQHSESLQILKIKKLSPSKFLFNKLVQNCKVYFFIILPLAFLFIFFHFEYWWFIFAEIFVLQLIIIFNIFLKYASFLPNKNLKHNALTSQIPMLGFIVPFILPALFLMIFIYYKKAINNLKNYLHDDN